MQVLSEKLHAISAGWLVWVSLVIFVAFMVFVLPAQALQSAHYTSNVGSPDTSLYYTKATLYKMAEAFGQDGRDAYVKERFGFDVIWPLVYGMFLMTGISWFTRRWKPVRDKAWQLNLVPVIAVLVDFLENLSAALVMHRYPSQTPVIDSLAGVFTSVKWLLVNGSFVILLCLIAALAWSKFRNRL